MDNINFDDACGFLNSLDERKIAAFLDKELPESEMEEIQSWLNGSEELREAFEGFKSLMRRHPKNTLNNYFQSSKEQFIQTTSLKIATTM